MEGIAVAGSILVDRINRIDGYPEEGRLTRIRGVSRAVGGCVPNVAIDLKTLSPALPVRAVGLVGGDEDGRSVFNALKCAGVDAGGVGVCGERTSFTEVMSVPGGQRTFFTYAGASARFGFSDVDFDAPAVNMLHLGYFLLLDKVDAGDGLKILREAKARGIKTSIDLVSERADKYASVLPCLAFTDTLIVNETEAGGLTGIEPTDANLERMAGRLKKHGVRERVIIHKPELAVCLSDDGFTALPSYDLPRGFIQGSTGAGDAFCAGCLLGLYEGLPDGDILELASMAAAAALGESDATSGMKNRQALKDLCERFERKRICL